MCVPKTSDHIQINIKMQNPSQEPPASSKAPNEDLKDMDVLCTFKIKIESQNLEYGWTKFQWPYPNQYQGEKSQSGTSSVLQSPNQDLKDIDVIFTSQIKIECQNLEHGCTKDQWPYPNQDEDSKPQSGTSSILKSPESVLKGHRHSLHLQNQDREPKFEVRMFQRPVITSRSRLKCLTPFRNLQHPPEPLIRT